MIMYRETMRNLFCIWSCHEILLWGPLHVACLGLGMRNTSTCNVSLEDCLRMPNHRCLAPCDIKRDFAYRSYRHCMADYHDLALRWYACTNSDLVLWFSHLVNVKEMSLKSPGLQDA